MSASAISGLNAFLIGIRRRKIDVVKAEPEWRRLIRKCYQLWGAYQSEPTDERYERLKLHLSLMGTSNSKKVKAVRKEISSVLSPKTTA